MNRLLYAAQPLTYLTALNLDASIIMQDMYNRKLKTYTITITIDRFCDIEMN